MGDRALTSDEIDSLLSIFRGGRAVLRSDTEVEEFDPDRPSRLSPGVMGALRIRHEQVARALTQEFKNRLGSLVRVTLEGYEQMLFHVWARDLGDPCCAFIVTMAPLPDPAVLAIEHGLAFRAIDRLLGGDGTTKIEARDLTPTEAGVLGEILEPIVQAHEQAWEPYTVLRGSVRRPVFVPRFIRDIADREVVLAATYRLEGFGDPTTLRFVLAASGLEPHLQHAPRPEARNDGGKGAAEKIARSLSQASLSMTARLGETALTLGEIMALAPDDVLVLNTDIQAPIDLLIEGARRARGYLCRRGSRLAFRLSTPIQDAAARGAEAQESGPPGGPVQGARS